jgi:NAD(P)-dependent dehydrogenase (short-subunit alcohol dehydrogenase family)
MDDLFSIKNKVIVITGAGNGIGSILAEEMWKRNAIIYSVDTVFSKAKKKENYFEIKSDITNIKKFNKICEQIFKKHNKIDILINNAGITFTKKDNEEYPIDKWEQTLKINLTGAFTSSQTVLKFMKKQKNGSIINITSINAEVGFPNNPAYVASKGGLKMLTKSLAKDYGKYGIRVNNLGPGYIKTNMTKKSFENKKIKKSREKQTLLGRWGEISDLIGPCIFLASNASKYLTGQDIYVDGGWLANGLVE